MFIAGLSAQRKDCCGSLSSSHVTGNVACAGRVRCGFGGERIGEMEYRDHGSPQHYALLVGPHKHGGRIAEGQVDLQSRQCLLTACKDRNGG